MFNRKDLEEDFKVAMRGYSYNPQLSLFIDIDHSSNDFESIFVQNVSTLEDIQGRIYIAKNIDVLISKLRLYLVGEQERLWII